MNFRVVNSHNQGEENILLFLRIHKIFVYKSHFMDARVIFVPLCILRFSKLCLHVAVSLCQCFRRWKALQMKSFLTPPGWFWNYLFKHFLFSTMQITRWLVVHGWLFCKAKYLSPMSNDLNPSEFWKVINL